MSEEVKNEDNNSKKKWLWLLLLLLLIIFIVIAIVVFLKDDGTAEAADNISDEISQEQVTNNDEPKDESRISSNEKTQKLVVTAAETQLASAIATTGTTSTPTEKTPVVVNISDNSYFNEAVVLEITGEDFTATITDSNGKVSNYEGKATLSEDGKYTLTIKDSDGTEKTVSFTIDTTNPSITGVEDGKLYNTEVTPIIEELNIDKIVLTKDGNETEYNSGNTITEDGEYVLEVTDKAGNSTSVTFSIDTTAPELTVKKNITSMTKKSVTVTISANEEILLPNSDWKYVDETKTMIKKVYRQNIEEDVIVKDLYNNEGTTHIKITNIDKVAPIASVTTSNNNGNWSTNKDVTATLTVNEPIKDIPGWTKVDDTTYTKVYSDNKKEKFEIEDLVGNKTKVEFEVKRIDKVPPTITVTDPNNYKMEVNTEYVEKGYYAFDVMDKNVTNLVTKKYQFQAKGTGTWPYVDELDTSKLGTYKITYIAKDKAGNEAKGTRTVTIVDTTPPRLSLNGDAKIKIEAGIDTYTELGATVIDNYDETITNLQPKYINYSVNNVYQGKVKFVDNTKLGTYKIVYEHEDTSGNKGLDASRDDHIYVMRIVEVVDTTAPELTVTKNITSITKKSVTVTITSNEEILLPNSDWKYVNEAKTIIKKVYRENIEEDVFVKDLSGNEGKVHVKITNIDKVAPTLTVKPNSLGKDPSYRTINFKLTDNRLVDKFEVNGIMKDIADSQWGDANYDVLASLVKEGENTIVVYDVAGNSTEYKFKMDWTAPAVANVEYSTTELTNGNVVVTITTSEPVYGHSGWSKGNRAYKITKTFTENAEETVVVTDRAGNKLEIPVKVTNIDKVAPTPSKIEYSTTELTNGNVKVTITATEPLYGHPGWSKGKAYVISKTFTENTEETVILKDKVGNENPITISVTNIDKVAPVVTVESIFEPVYDADGKMIDVKGGQRLIANEDVEIVNEPALVPVNGSSREYEIVYSLFNPTHTGYHFINITVRDRAGNETTTDIEIYIPEYPTSSASTTPNLNSTSLRMTKAAPKTVAVQTNTTPAVIEQEDNNDKSDDLLQNDLLTTDEKKDDTNVIPTDPIVDDIKDDQEIIETDLIPEDKKETIQAEPVVDNGQKDDQKDIPTEPIVETPVVEEPKTEATPAPVEDVEEIVATESEVLDPVIAE